MLIRTLYSMLDSRRLGIDMCNHHSKKATIEITRIGMVSMRAG